jgi:hypothetical protein
LAKDGKKKKKSSCGRPSALLGDESDDNHEDDGGQATVSYQAEMEISQVQLRFIIAHCVQARGDIGRGDIFSEKCIKQAGQLNGSKR